MRINRFVLTTDSYINTDQTTETITQTVDAEVLAPGIINAGFITQNDDINAEDDDYEMHYGISQDQNSLKKVSGVVQDFSVSLTALPVDEANQTTNDIRADIIIVSHNNSEDYED